MTAHQHILRVYYADTDAGGVVYHARYLEFLERARTEMVRATGLSDAELTRETGGVFVMVEANLKYKSPARLDDELIIATNIAHMGGASLKLQQNVLKRVAGHDSLLLEGNIAMVYVSLTDFKPMRIPQNFRDTMQPYLETKEENHASA